MLRFEKTCSEQSLGSICCPFQKKEVMVEEPSQDRRGTIGCQVGLWMRDLFHLASSSL